MISGVSLLLMNELLLKHNYRNTLKDVLTSSLADETIRTFACMECMINGGSRDKKKLTGGSDGRQCSSARRVAFISNIEDTPFSRVCYRYGITHSSNLVLPRTKDLLLNSSAKIQEYLHYIPGNESYDLVCQGVLPLETIKATNIMSSSVVYVGILGDPRYNHALPIMINSTQPTHSKTNKKKEHSNPTFHALISRKIVNFNNTPQQLISDIDKSFKIILIQEMIAASLVYLRRTLCWSMSDIIIGTPTVWKEHSVSDQNVPITSSRNMVEHSIYDHYRSILSSKLEKNENYFKDEVSYLKDIIRSFGEFCNISTLVGHQSYRFLEVKKSRWNGDFLLSSRDCRLMNLDLENAIAEARYKSKVKYDNWRENQKKLTDSYQFKLLFKKIKHTSKEGSDTEETIIRVEERVIQTVRRSQRESGTTQRERKPVAPNARNVVVPTTYRATEKAPPFMSLNEKLAHAKKLRLSSNTQGSSITSRKQQNVQKTPKPVFIIDDTPIGKDNKIVDIEEDADNLNEYLVKAEDYRIDEQSVGEVKVTKDEQVIGDAKTTRDEQVEPIVNEAKVITKAPPAKSVAKQVRVKQVSKKRPVTHIDVQPIFD